MSGAIRASCLRKTCLCLGTPMSYLPVIAIVSYSATPAPT